MPEDVYRARVANRVLQQTVANHSDSVSVTPKTETILIVYKIDEEISAWQTDCFYDLRAY